MPAGRPRKYATKEEARKAGIKKAIQWRKDHPEQYKETLKNRRKKNASYFSKNQARYIERNRERYNKTRRERIRIKKLEDPIFKFRENTRNLIRRSFERKGNYKKKTRSEEILGCSIGFFIEYILSLCPKGVTLKDFGRYGYHIDHIIPISSAKNEEDIIKLCHYTNLQPLWHTENIKKSNKII